MLGFFILWLNHAAGAILIVSPSFSHLLLLLISLPFLPSPSLQAWMADLCPSPEERAVIIGVACTFLYAVDSFANSKYPSPRVLFSS